MKQYFSELKYKEKLRKSAYNELKRLISKFEKQYTFLSKTEVLKEVERHLLAEDKSLSYAGGRNVPLTFAVGLITIVIAATVLNIEAEENIIDFYNQQFTDINSLRMSYFPKAILYITTFLASVIQFLVIIGPVYLFSFIFDSDRRKSIYKVNYMLGILKDLILKEKSGE